MVGRNPTTPQKLAGVRREPPKSEPVASQAIPVAKATADPPDEPPAEHAVPHGFRVIPNTSLKVFAPRAEFRRIRFGINDGAMRL